MARVAKDNGSTRTWLSDVREKCPACTAKTERGFAIIGAALGEHVEHLWNDNNPIVRNMAKPQREAFYQALDWLEFRANRRGLIDNGYDPKSGEPPLDPSPEPATPAETPDPAEGPTCTG